MYKGKQKKEIRRYEVGLPRRVNNSFSPWTGSALESASCSSAARSSSAAVFGSPAAATAVAAAVDRDLCAKALCSLDFQYTVPSVATHLSFMSRSCLFRWWPVVDRKCCAPTSNLRPSVVTISPSRPTYSVYGPRKYDEFTCVASKRKYFS